MIKLRYTPVNMLASLAGDILADSGAKTEDQGQS
jgi:hypothetical protein